MEQDVVPTIYPEAERLVGDHLAKGHVVAIVSGATKFVVRPLAEHLGIKHLLYTRLEVEKGLLTPLVRSMKGSLRDLDVDVEVYRRDREERHL